jgi:uncharacterized protein YjbI with pentapeptide repeats
MTVSWERCEAQHEGSRCTGVQLRDHRCLAHTDEETRLARLAELREGDSLSFVRGVPFSTVLLYDIMSQAPRDRDECPILKNADFNRALFEGDTNFSRARFVGRADFSGVRFRGTTDFSHAAFEDDAWFGVSTFDGTARFGATKFNQWVSFGNAIFRREAWFGDATFAGHAWLNARFDLLVQFNRAVFERARRTGLMLGRAVSLDEASFLQGVQIEAAGAEISCHHAQFMGGATLRLHWADVSLDGAEFARPSILVGGPARAVDLVVSEEEDLGQVLSEYPAQRLRPNLVSMKGTDVGNLVLSNIDLRRCEFVGAHNLDRLRIEGADSFARAPHLGKARGRLVIAEEVVLRRKAGDKQWEQVLDETELPAEPLDAEDVASIYRALRKGREDNKDEVGGADFYYGEMEMRRRSKSIPPGERLILWFYWLVSGYGLRASRALISLLITVALFAIMLWQWGFSSAEPLIGAIFFSASSTTSLLRAPEANLTYVGEGLNMILRLLGPLFFGLALLSLRGRVKR